MKINGTNGTNGHHLEHAAGIEVVPEGIDLARANRLLAELLRIVTRECGYLSNDDQLTISDVRRHLEAP